MRQRLRRLNQKHLSIRWKLIIPFIAITILVFIFSLPITTRLVTNRFEAEADRQLVGLAQSVGALISDTAKQARLSANLIAGLPELESTDTTLIKATLDAKKAELDLQEISIYPNNFQPGDPAAIYGGPIVARRLQTSEQTEAIRGALILESLNRGEAVSGIAIAPQASQIIGVSPITSMENGGITGVVVTAVFMDDAYVENISNILGTDVGIVKDNAVIVSTIDPDSGYERSLQEGFINGAQSSGTIVYGDDTSYRLLADDLTIGDEIQGTVLVAQPIDELLQIQQDIQNVFLIFAGFIILISLILGVLMYFNFARPLQRLSIAAKEMSAGHLDQRVPDYHTVFQDEISDLSHTFNEMVDELQALYAGLEYRVEKRTEELEEEQQKLNDALEKLAIARDEAVAANLAKSEFVSLVSHELKVPMTSIRGYNQLMADGMVGEVNEQQADFLARVELNVQRMMTLVSDLTDISRIETGQLNLDYDVVELDDVVEEVVTSSQANIEAKEQSISVILPQDLPTVWGDKNRLTQVMTNLVSNANKYTPDGGDISINAKMLEARTSQGALDKDCVLVSVKDTGIGIHPDDFPKMFQKFFRSDDEKTRQAQGTGLGLTITKNLVELQGGSIWFESEFRKGTTFFFTIPTANGQPQAI